MYCPKCQADCADVKGEYGDAGSGFHQNWPNRTSYGYRKSWCIKCETLLEEVYFGGNWEECKRITAALQAIEALGFTREESGNMLRKAFETKK